MADNYTGWTITRNESSDSFGDLSGYDEAASINRFCELLRERLAAEFPGADITVNQAQSTRPTEVYAPEGATEDDEISVADRVDDVVNALFGDGEWVVAHDWLRETEQDIDRLDLADEYVTVGPLTIQHDRLYGPGLPTEGKWLRQAPALWKMLRAIPGVILHVEHTGVRSGHGHGRETVTLANADGTLIYQRVCIDHCEGPGYSCSYSHGPWEKYGKYNGFAEPDPDIARALEALATLRAKLQH